MDKTKLLEALDEDKKGNWKKAHEIVQQLDSKEACWIHAYLHRKEGDPGNAGYWYARAGKQFSSRLLEEEWQQLYEAVNKIS